MPLHHQLEENITPYVCGLLTVAAGPGVPTVFTGTSLLMSRSWLSSENVSEPASYMNPLQLKSYRTAPNYLLTSQSPAECFFSSAHQLDAKAMIYHNHPYDGWAEAGQGLSSPWPQTPAPSILGALPYPTVSHASSLVTYHISNFAPHVLNSKVVGPDGRMCFTISTDHDMPGYTTVKNAQGNAIALIEWKSSPIIEIRGLLSKQPVRSWLRLSSDRRPSFSSARAMEIHGVKYIWAPHNQSINLHAGDFARTFLANVARTQNSIAIQITSDALQQKLLESIIIAAMLLQCGRNID
ncbi:hypothetical protein C0991_006111 [Blastosporella zonata]|nr:hypothetical protein C0991_006111 [Blastosporella zonata]